MALFFQKFLTKSKPAVISQPPYSPDLSLGNFTVSEIKIGLKGAT
jgi:hypothetical protein